MNIDQATRLSIVEFLSWLGHRPVTQKGRKFWYVSPFRNETKPSFKVNMEINMWYDFGEGAGGGIISLAKRLYNTNDMSTVLRRLQDKAPSTIVYFSRPTQPREPQCTMKNVVRKPLESQALLDYARRRGISCEVAKCYCKEISYEIYGRRYFTIAFPNSSGGYELRNPYFKGCMGRKDITILEGEKAAELDTSCCHVFEGFFDFLSFRVLQAMGKLRLPSYGTTHYIILNSVNNLEKALREMTHVERIFTYLDNDQAGRKATKTIFGLYAPRTVDLSFMFEGNNDLNDYLLHVKADGKKQ